jgi:pyruvate/2-oxoglutarate/acetoin dehydrogenase E1 component
MTRSMLDALNSALLQALGSDPNVILLGEDILDPYGGAFKVTKGCSTAFPDRVVTSPISEAGLAGVAAGMALRGLRPVLEIMFGDFLALQADQLINHISKFRWMYNDTVNLPLVIRTPMGGRRGYGPTHSQTLEKIFMGIPGLTLIAPVNIASKMGYVGPEKMLSTTILTTENPVIFIENKLQYLLPVIDADSQEELNIHISYDSNDPGMQFPVHLLTVNGAPAPTVTITAYGYMAEIARQAVLKLAFDHEVFAELVVPTRLAPFGLDEVMGSAKRTGNLVVLEEGTLSMGWGAEVTARVAESSVGSLKNVKRIAAKETPIPASSVLERETLPQVEDVVNEIRKMGEK